MNIILLSAVYNIEILEINTIYTHMLGSDCYFIIAGATHVNAMLEKVKEKYLVNSGINYLEMTANYFFSKSLKVILTKKYVLTSNIV